jgi:hypothetical protein
MPQQMEGWISKFVDFQVCTNKNEMQIQNMFLVGFQKRKWSENFEIKLRNFKMYW